MGTLEGRRWWRWYGWEKSRGRAFCHAPVCSIRHDNGGMSLFLSLGSYVRLPHIAVQRAKGHDEGQDEDRLNVS
eukprot:scaffold37827_cov221-Amphora_coffeaeformis.AAC.1